MKYFNCSMLSWTKNCVASILLLFSINSSLSGQCSLACNGSTQVSLNATCEATITFDMILNDQASSCPSGNFEVVVSDQNGTIVNSPIVSGDFVGQTLIASVVDMVSGNSCWGDLVIEDKLGPAISNCPTAPISLPCIDMSIFTGVEFTDNCQGILTPVLISETVDTPCDDDIIKVVTREYAAVDSHGNVTDSNCPIVLELLRFDTSLVTFPDSFLVVNNTALNCAVASDFDSNNNGKIDKGEVPTALTGFPIYEVATTTGIDTIDLYPFPDVYCNTVVSFDDTVLPKIGCVQKIMRRWNITEWHCNGERIYNYVQIIEVADDLGPVLSCQTSLTLTTNTLIGSAPSGSYGDVTCGSTVQLPLPSATDNCSNNLRYDLTYNDSALVQDYDGNSTIVLPMGTNSVVFTVYDDCYNSSTCSTMVEIVDNTPPIAICDQYTVASLTSDGTAYIRATSFDDGSYDDCKLHCSLVRRMDTGDCACNVMEYCNLDYLGERDGSHYYLSDYEISATVAKNRAAAYGGGLVIFDNSSEEEWVTTQVRTKSSERFWIGMKRFDSGFSWDDHEAVSYNNFVGGTQPAAGGDCVMVTPGNVWNTGECTRELKYVFEVKGDCGFSNGVNFCCNDVNTIDNMVTYRVIDVFGNFNDCMVNVNIQDKSAPVLTCPNDMTVNCDVVYDDNNLVQLFGDVATSVNCGAGLINRPVEDNTTECGAGQLVRRFNAMGGDNNATVLSTCKQIVTFVNNDPFDGDLRITCPEQETIIDGCDNPGNFGPDVTGKPEFLGGVCDLLGMDYDDEVFTFNGDISASSNACFKILREWQIIDWCQTDPLTGRSKVWTCNQVIKVTNDIKPVITGCKELNVCTFDSDCESGFVDLEVFAEDDCTLGANLRWTYSIYTGAIGLGPISFTDPVATESGFGDNVKASGKYPLGQHVIRWTFFDGCGNSQTCDQAFTVSNCKAATSYCINGLAIDLMKIETPDGTTFGTVDVWAKDFDAGSSHPCGYPVHLSFSPTDLTQTNMTFNCDTRGQQSVDVWATVETPDGQLIQTFCTSFIDVQDNQGACQGRITVNVNGNVATENHEIVEDVSVILDGSPMQTNTDVSGNYAFPSMSTGGNYIVNPSSNNNPLNGISTADLIGIQRHILGAELLDSPYKIIAADVDNNGKLNGQDLIELRKLILGIYSDFPQNDSWRFVDENYEFTNSANPLAEPFVEDYIISSITSDMVIDFVAVKVGDVNNSVVTNLDAISTGRATNNTTAVEIETVSIAEGDIFKVPFDLGEESINGFQMEISYDNESVEILGVNGSNISPSNYTIGNNSIKLSWNSNTSVTGEAFEIIAVAKTDSKISNLFTINNNNMTPEIYTIAGDVLTPVLDAGLDNDITNGNDFQLFQNSPNPFSGTTEVKFSVPSRSLVVFNIHDVNGKLVKSYSDTFDKGLRSVNIDAKELGATGVMYLSVSTEEEKETIKLIVLK